MNRLARRRRLGIAIVIHTIDATGGMERQALRLGEHLARRGVRVWILSSVVVEGSLPVLPAGTRWAERRGLLTIHRVPMCIMWHWNWALSLYELVITAMLATRAPVLDAIYAVHWTTAVQASRVARFLRAPLFMKFAGGGEYGDFSQIERRSDRGTVLAELANVERLICISPQIAAEAQRAGLSAERCLRIPNGVDIDRFENVRPVPLPGPEGSDHVLVVGALRPEKRLPELVRAFVNVARARPSAHLVIAGEGAEEPAIRAAAHETGLEERIHLLGKRGDVPGLLAAARVFVLPSRSEGMSNALLEALAAGTPIVATNIEGNRAVVEHEKEALLVPVGDPEALAGAVLRLLGDPDLAARLSRAGRAKVREYAFDKVAESYESAFSQAARPLPSSLWLCGASLVEIARSLTARLGILGKPILKISFSGLNRQLVWLYMRIGAVRVRDWFTDRVVDMKRWLGIEGEIMARVRGHESRSTKM